MTAALLPVVAAATKVDIGVFVVCAVIVLAGAFGVVFSRNPVHSALMLVMTLFGVAVLFVAQEAHFLAAVQVIVYAGAIMVLFLFVLMFIGGERRESLVETLRGQLLGSVLAGLGFAGLVTAGIGRGVLDSEPVGLAQANAEGNVLAIARLLFTDYVFAFEVTSALLIVAAVGAMVLAHKERTGPRQGQRERMTARFAGTHPTPSPGPAVYADDQQETNPPVTVT